MQSYSLLIGKRFGTPTQTINNNGCGCSYRSQAIVNEAHRLGKIVPDRTRRGDEYAAFGAYVANPKRGWHEWIGSIDLNSHIHIIQLVI